jgi:hypothetical protein
MWRERMTTGVPTVVAVGGTAVATGGEVLVGGGGTKVGLASTVGATVGGTVVDVGGAAVGPTVRVGGVTAVGVDVPPPSAAHANVVLKIVSKAIEGRISLRIWDLLSRLWLYRV